MYSGLTIGTSALTQPNKLCTCNRCINFICSDIMAHCVGNTGWVLWDWWQWIGPSPHAYKPSQPTNVELSIPIRALWTLAKGIYHNSSRCVTELRIMNYMYVLHSMYHSTLSFVIQLYHILLIINTILLLTMQRYWKVRDLHLIWYTQLGKDFHPTFWAFPMLWEGLEQHSC